MAENVVNKRCGPGNPLDELFEQLPRRLARGSSALSPLSDHFGAGPAFHLSDPATPLVHGTSSFSHGVTVSNSAEASLLDPQLEGLGGGFAYFETCLDGFASDVTGVLHDEPFLGEFSGG